LDFFSFGLEIDFRTERHGGIGDDAGTFTGTLYQQWQRGEFLILWKWCPELKLKQVEQLGTKGDWVCNQCQWHNSYCVWPPEGVHQKSCNQCAAQKIVCTVAGMWVSNRKWWDQSGAEGLQPQKKSQVEVESEAESEWSGLGGRKDQGWRQEVSTLVEIQELLREQNGNLKRISQSLDGGLGSW